MEELIANPFKLALESFEFLGLLDDEPARAELAEARRFQRPFPAASGVVALGQRTPAAVAPEGSRDRVVRDRVARHSFGPVTALPTGP